MTLQPDDTQKAAHQAEAALDPHLGRVRGAWL
jgi:hypothetical protein